MASVRYATVNHARKANADVGNAPVWTTCSGFDRADLDNAIAEFE